MVPTVVKTMTSMTASGVLAGFTCMRRMSYAASRFPSWSSRRWVLEAPTEESCSSAKKVTSFVGTPTRLASVVVIA